MKNGFAGVFILVGVLIIAGIAGGAYYLGRQTVQLTPLPSPTPTGAGETANWKIYTNSEYGFNINYPPDWTIKEDKQGDFIPLTMGFRAPKGNSSVDIRVTNQSLEDWKRENRYEIMDDTQFNGMPALWAASKDSIDYRAGGTYVMTTPTNQDKIVLIIWLSDPTDPQKKDVAILKQIISTFKFQ